MTSTARSDVRYKIELSRVAEAAYVRLARADRKLRERAREALLALGDDPRLGKPLKHELKGRWSYRIGSYRVIYRIKDDRLVVLVLDIGHRREIYG